MLHSRDFQLDWLVPKRSRKARLGRGVRVNFKHHYIRVSSDMIEPYRDKGPVKGMAFHLKEGEKPLITLNPGPGVAFYAFVPHKMTENNAYIVVNRDLCERMAVRFQIDMTVAVRDFELKFHETYNGMDLYQLIPSDKLL